MDTNSYRNQLLRHYENAWGTKTLECKWVGGRALKQDCVVVEFAPTEKTFCWTYSTCGMTVLTEPSLLELFIMSPCQNEALVELLTMVAQYHQTEAKIDLGHTVDFGRPWLANSRCSFGLVSLPYAFGPTLEWVAGAGERIRVLWLLPITSDERKFKVSAGAEALETIFEEKQFDCLDPSRASVV